MTDAKEELAALQARVAELERAAPKPTTPFKSDDWVVPNPIDRVSMPLSAMREMAAAIPDHVVRDIALRDCRAPTGPSSQGVVASSQQLSNVRPAGGTGWQAPIPLSSPPGVAQADRLMDEQDQKDRAELVEREAKFRAMQQLAERKP
jgi:hypothetical protein